MSKQFVFVYGSLLRGLHNHDVIANQTFVAEGATVDPYHLLSLRGFPGAVSGDCLPNPKPILGELYAVDSDGMALLDRLESNGQFYQRYTTDVLDTEGNCYEAWCYFLIDEPHYVETCEPVPHNDWAAHYAEAPFHPLNQSATVNA